MAGRSLLVPLLLATVFCSSCSVHAGGEGLDYLRDAEFHQWVSQYYSDKDGEDLAEIYPTWRRNADFVKEHNSLGLSYTVALNKFAHLDISRLVGKSRHVPPTSESLDRTPHHRMRDIPTSVDWREKGVIAPVTSQGQCDNSGLYVVVDSIDAIWAIKSGTLVLASREECRDCCLRGGGCNGNTSDMSLFQCIIRLGGLAAASDYKSPNHTCQSKKFTPVVKISGAAYVSTHGDEQVLAEAVARQPIAVAVDASHSSFQLYSSGVYYDSNCSSVSLDHVMLVVGYGSMNGEDYWIVKNSWGEDWGMKGYILMARNKNNNCGIASRAVYPYISD